MFNELPNRNWKRSFVVRKCMEGVADRGVLERQETAKKQANWH